MRKCFIKFSGLFSVMVLLSFSLSGATIIDSDLQVTGNTTLEQEAEIKGNVRISGHEILLQEENGSCPAIIIFKDSDSMGGMEKARIQVPMGPYMRGIGISVDGSTEALQILDNGDVVITGTLTVNGNLYLNGELFEPNYGPPYDDCSGHDINVTQYLSGNQTYNLMTPINFDSEIDPDNYVNGMPLTFTSPISGSYAVGVRITGSTIQSTVGCTSMHMYIGKIEVKRNGQTVLCNYLPLIPCNDCFDHNAFGIIHLIAGDQLTVCYSIMTMGCCGPEPVNGTVTLHGSPDVYGTNLEIHNISDDNPPPQPNP